MCSPGKRRDTDITKLMMNGFKVELIENSTNKFYVEFKGPQNSLYQDGVWMVRVEVPSDYPYKSPSIRFSNKIYHPNIHAIVGSICVDVLEQNWYPTYDLLNVFEIFLPQLLLYPNPEDPLNGEAGALMLQDREAYEQKVKEYCLRYAKAGNLGGKQDEEGSKQEDEGGVNTVATSDEGGEDTSDEGGEGIWIFIENRN